MSRFFNNSKIWNSCLGLLSSIIIIQLSSQTEVTTQNAFIWLFYCIILVVANFYFVENLYHEFKNIYLAVLFPFAFMLAVINILSFQEMWLAILGLHLVSLFAFALNGFKKGFWEAFN